MGCHIGKVQTGIQRVTACEPDRWRDHITSHPYFNRDVECFVILLLNTRRRIQGHCLISTGTLDTILVHAREVFRPAIIAAASSIILLHNHPSGDPTPSEADIKVTRDLIRGGQLLKIDVLDHVIIGRSNEAGRKDYQSLRVLGKAKTGQKRDRQKTVELGDLGQPSGNH